MPAFGSMRHAEPAENVVNVWRHSAFILHAFNVSAAGICRLVQIWSCCLLQEFIRIGYYVNNDYPEEELRENPPDPPSITK